MNPTPELPEPPATTAAGSAAGALRVRFENITFDEARGELRADDELVAVEPRPLRLLAELLRHVNEVVTKDELLDSVWDGRPTVDNVLPTAINRLRKALGEPAARRIVNLPRVGYRFDGPVQHLERRGPGDADAATPAFQPGQAVPGREQFELVRALGASSSADAHNAVWLARHAKLGGERVFKFALTPEALRALKREYTLNRLLRESLGDVHTVAVPLLDANFTQPPFFLEMAFAGQNLREWAEEGGRLAAMPRPERLALFVQVARAVASAHGVGVLHKDLKPGNVLISGEPGHWLARLGDFGSGRALEPHRLQALGVTALGLTQTQGADTDAGAGTLMYLAPELLGGAAATVQSDVYALGLMLYQLLVAEFRQALVSGWQRDVGDELLEADILAATDGDLQHRLASAAALAERVESLAARRAERHQQAQAAAEHAAAAAAERRRQARRPWLWLAGCGLVSGLLVSGVFQWRAEQALLAAQDERERATAISEFLQRDLLEAPEVLTMGSVKPATMLQVLRRAAAVAHLRFAGRPRDEAATRRRLGEAFLRLASLVDAAEEMNKARRLLEPVAPAADTELLAVRLLQARLAAWRLDAKAAQAELDAVAALAPEQLKLPTELAYLAAQARHELYYQTRRKQEALPNAERLVQLADTLFPNTVHLRADARQRKAEVLHFLGREAEVAALVAELERPPFLAKRLVAEFEMRRIGQEAEDLEDQGRWHEALARRQSAHRHLLAQPAPSEFYLAWTAVNLANDLHVLGQFAEAQPLYEQAMALFVAVMGPEHQWVPSTQLQVAFNLLELGRLPQVLTVLDEVQQWQQSQSKTTYREFVTLARASAWVREGRAAEGLALLGEIEPQKSPSPHFGGGLALRISIEKARALLALGRRQEARTLLDAARALAPAGPAWPWVVRDLARLQAQAGP